MLCSQFALTHLFDKGVVLKVLFWYEKGQKNLHTLFIFNHKNASLILPTLTNSQEAKEDY